jgi:alpha-tubulin suppressor-like RCC1 family protein
MSSAPVHVDTLPAPVRQVDWIGALVAENVVMRWGSNGCGELGVPTAFLDWSNVPVAIENLEGTPVRIGDGGDFACVAMEDGRVQCWGENYHGELGRGYTGAPSAIPTDVVDLSGPAVDVCTAGRTVCALLVDGGIMCWGQGGGGMLGDGLDPMECPEWDSCLFPTPVKVIGFGPEE